MNTGQSGDDELAGRMLARYALPDDVVMTLISRSENSVYCIEDPASGRRWALRLHRRDYHSIAAIASELAWLQAIARDTNVIVPRPIAGADGALIQILPAAIGQRAAVLFHWEQGHEPPSNDAAAFGRMGEAAAHLHRHARAWKRPPGFTRHTWNFDTTIGETPHWGRWRDGIGMTASVAEAISETLPVIRERVSRMGSGPSAYNLIHGDMRLANILDDRGTVKVIDFDDCGFSWLLYDAATTVSFFEDAPEVPDLMRAWARGYRRVGTLTAEEEAEIATFVMIRRILLVAWIGSHADTDLARSLGERYTERTAPMCERYLSLFGGRTRTHREPPPGALA